jgi:hypothetical protein
MQTVFWKSIRSILIIFLLSACNFPSPGQSAPELVENPVTKSPTKTVEPQGGYEPVECAFMWANESLSDLSDDFNKALKKIQPEAEGYAQAYGENCVTNQGEIVRFHAMETDYYITFKVEDLDNQQTLGELIEGVMEVMAEFPTDETPGPQPGYIDITFESDTDSLRMWVKRTEIEVSMNDGLQGEELFNALQSQ